MKLEILLLNLFYAFVALFFFFAAYKLFKKLTPELDFHNELVKGNVAMGIFLAGFFVGLAIVIAAAVM